MNLYIQDSNPFLFRNKERNSNDLSSVLIEKLIVAQVFLTIPCVVWKVNCIVYKSLLMSPDEPSPEPYLLIFKPRLYFILPFKSRSYN
jgi:hypothetical protein